MKRFKVKDTTNQEAKRRADFSEDPYAIRISSQDPIRCPDCNSVFTNGSWVIGADLVNIQPIFWGHRCPACRRIRDCCPAAVVQIEGRRFLNTNATEVIRLMRNFERLENQSHPLGRIMGIRPNAFGLEVSTTEIHLARAISKTLNQAFGGYLNYPSQKLTGGIFRVIWTVLPTDKIGRGAA